MRKNDDVIILAKNFSGLLKRFVFEEEHLSVAIPFLGQL